MFAVSSLQDHPWPILLISLVMVFAQQVDRSAPSGQFRRQEIGKRNKFPPRNLSRLPSYP